VARAPKGRDSGRRQARLQAPAAARAQWATRRRRRSQKAPARQSCEWGWPGARRARWGLGGRGRGAWGEGGWARVRRRPGARKVNAAAWVMSGPAAGRRSGHVGACMHAVGCAAAATTAWALRCRGRPSPRTRREWEARGAAARGPADREERAPIFLAVCMVWELRSMRLAQPRAGSLAKTGCRVVELRADVFCLPERWGIATPIDIKCVAKGQVAQDKRCASSNCRPRLSSDYADKAPPYASAQPTYPAPTSVAVRPSTNMRRHPDLPGVSVHHTRGRSRGAAGRSGQCSWTHTAPRLWAVG
jgi:hypothetical protein